MNNKKILSIYDTYKLSIEIAKDKSPQLKKTFIYYILGSVSQGIALSCFYPLLHSFFVAKFNFNESLFWINIMILFFIVFAVFKWFAHDFDYNGNIVSISHNLRYSLGEKLKRIPLQKLYSYRTGELNHTLSSSVEDSVLHMGVISGMLIEIFVIPFTIFFVTLFIDWRISLIMIILLPLLIPIYIWKRKATRQEKIDSNNIHSNLEADIIEYIQGLYVLKSINLVGENSEKLQSSIKEAREVQKKGLISSTIPMILASTLIEFTFLLVFSLGTYWITNSTMIASTLCATLIILVRLTEPLSNFLAISAVIDIMDAGFKKIKDLKKIKELQIYETKQKIKNYDISFKNVSFNYDNKDKNTLKNISLKIKENSLTAIVGPSGSGKTTLIKLITRYADPNEGEILIGGVNIKNITQKELMKNISVVFQDVYLFDDTIYNNIKMGDPKAKKEDIIKASKKANCHDFIEKLPNKYQTKLGEIGSTLSGGQRQRISIARAILKNTSIVILDEPTSALDTHSEVLVQEALDSLIKNKTVIVIAHRLSTISHANNIIVMNNGEIVEVGKHEQLLKNKEKYYELVEAQNRVKEWRLNDN